MMDRPFHKADLRLLILGKEYEIHMIYEPAYGSRRCGPDLDFH